MSDVMLAHTTPAANSAQVRQTTSKAASAKEDSGEITEGSNNFSKVLEGQVEHKGSASASGERLNTESERQTEAPVAVNDVAADGKDLPADVLDSLPQELIDLLDKLPDDVKDDIVAQFNAMATPEMAIPAQQKILVREIQAALRQLPDMQKMAADALKTLPDVLQTANRHAAEQGAEQLEQVKQMLAETGDRIQDKARSAFQQLTAQILRPATNSAKVSTDKPALPDSAISALHSLQGDTNQSQTVQRSAPTSTQLNIPFQQQGWDNELSERIVWMANQKLQRAEIKMNPPHLGPIEVRLNISGDQAQVHFSAHHGMVRDALESALPRLRDMFGANGLDLVDVDVADHSEAGKQRFAETAEDGRPGQDVQHGSSAMEEDDSTVSGVNLLNTSTPMGAIDYFV